MSKQMVETGKCEDPQLASVKEVISSRGVPLDPAVQARLEKQFDRNFDFVRVHFDEHASRSARLLNARAYTVGAHIVFAKGHYNPETQTGQWLLAHELTHVVQQGSGCSVPPLGLSKADHPLEHIADQAADIIAAGCSFPQDFVFGSAPAGVVQCHIVPNDPTHAQCPGYAIGTDATMIQEAERTIEFAYQGAPGVGGLIVYGSNDLQWPEGMLVDRRRTAFVTELLTMLRATRRTASEYTQFYFAGSLFLPPPEYFRCRCCQDHQCVSPGRRSPRTASSPADVGLRRL